MLLAWKWKWLFKRVVRGRELTERQLAALAEGRKKRWLKKQEELKEEEKESSEEDKESTDQSSSEEEESKSESEFDSVPSISTAD